MAVTISTTIQDDVVVLQSDTTEDALIQLARRLPVGWSMKSCLSCRYGHFCPVGDYDNELFCVTDFEPKEPRNLWHVTENDEERAKRSRTLFDLCDKYAPQSKDYFTYSDYYLIMSDKKSGRQYANKMLSIMTITRERQSYYLGRKCSNEGGWNLY